MTPWMKDIDNKLSQVFTAERTREEISVAFGVLPWHEDIQDVADFLGEVFVGPLLSSGPSSYTTRLKNLVFLALLIGVYCNDQHIHPKEVTDDVSNG